MARFEEARNVAHVLGLGQDHAWRAGEFYELLGVTPRVGLGWLRRLEAAGLVAHNHARTKARRWWFVPARERPGYRQEPRRHERPPEVEAVARVARGAAVAPRAVGRGARRRVREFAGRGAAAYEVVRTSKHSIYLEGPEGRVSIARNPKDHRADRNARRARAVA